MRRTFLRRAGEARRRRAAAEGGQGARPRAEALLRPLPFGCSRLWGGGAHRSTQLSSFDLNCFGARCFFGFNVSSVQYGVVCRLSSCRDVCALTSDACMIVCYRAL